MIVRIEGYSFIYSKICSMFMQLRNEFSVCRVYKNLGCLRPFDRRPVTAGTSSANQTVAEATSDDRQNNISGAKRARSEDGLSAEEDGSHHGPHHEGTINSDMFDQDLNWDTLDWF